MQDRRENSPAAAPISRRRRVLFALVPCAALFLGLELLCRVTGCGAPEVSPPSPPDFREVELTSPDGVTSKYRESVYVGQPVRTNASGFRDWFYDQENREHAIRVAGLGDSFTFGDGLAEDDTWLRRLGTKLAPLAPAGRPLRTLNFGRRGANTAEEAAMLDGHVLRFRPDLVILGFTLFNDAETAVYRTDATKAYVEREKSLVWRLAHGAHDASYLVNFVSDRLRRGKKHAEMTAHIESEYADDAPGWVECRAALSKIAATCRDGKVPLIVVIFPSHHRDPALNDWAHYEYAAEHAKVRAVLADHPEAVVVDMAAHLADFSGKTIWIEGNGHPDAVYAERVAQVLEAEAARLLGLAGR